MQSVQVAKQFEIKKNSEILPGLFTAWPTVCKERVNGVFKEYVDLQGDIVAEAAAVDMVKATAGQVCKVQFTHNDVAKTVGHIVEKILLTEDIQKDLGIQCDFTGILCHIQAIDEEAAETMRNGCMLSIGGVATEYEEL